MERACLVTATTGHKAGQKNNPLETPCPPVCVSQPGSWRCELSPGPAPWRPTAAWFHHLFLDRATSRFLTSRLHLLSISSSKSCSPDIKVLPPQYNRQCPKRPYPFGTFLILGNVSSALLHSPSLVPANTSFLFPRHPSIISKHTHLSEPFSLLSMSSSRGWPKQQQQHQGV